MLRAAYDEIFDLAIMCEVEIKKLEKEFGERKHPGEESLTKAIAITLERTLRVGTKNISIDSSFFDICKYTEEKYLGADLLIVYAFNSKILQVSNGVLIQAKKLENGAAMSDTGDMDSFRGQCAKMLSHTQQSYAWLYDANPKKVQIDRARRSYSRRHFRSIRASLVKNLNNNFPDQLHFEPIPMFIFNLMLGYVGDEELGLKNYDRLVEVIESSNVKYVLLLTANIGPDLRLDVQKDEPKYPYTPEQFDLNEEKLKIIKSLNTLREVRNPDNNNDVSGPGGL